MGEYCEEKENESEPKNNSLQLVVYHPLNVVKANENQNPWCYQPWLVLDLFFILGIFYDMPKHPDKFFPKIDPDWKDSAEDHVLRKRYELILLKHFQNLLG